MFEAPLTKPSRQGISMAYLLKISMILLFGFALAGCAGNRFNVEDGPANVRPGTAQDFAVNVGDRVFFETDSSELTARAKATLDLQAEWLGNYSQYGVTIEGHADERGTREYNLALGARRAAATRSFLSAQGVPASSMRTISYGKERPVAVCDDISCWSQNRRAVTVLGGAGS